ncbi:triacylglycerol lipase 2-like [Nymphaea colorata]|nr:triacylglycerol lipase 2-like [Nymphaea colorata]
MAGRISLVLAVFLSLTLRVAYCTTDVCLTVKSYGYDCHDYKVTTGDGYILTLQRVHAPPHGGRHRPDKPGRPVLLQHGVTMDGMAWVMNGAEQSLAFALADGGFDVWIANSRGTRFSRGHNHLTADTDRSYWSWTWVELANFDLAANVDFVYNHTGQKVYYVGHSLGTLTMLVSLSQHKLVDKLKAAALLTPIAHLNHITTGLLQLGANVYGGELLNLLGVSEFVPRSETVDHLLEKICVVHSLDCRDLFSAITGDNCCLNSTAMDLFLKYAPQATSTMTVVHFAQMVRTGNVTMYDFGNIFANLKHYGQLRPPVYNLAAIPADFPLFLSYGGRDALSDVKDVGLLLDELRDHQEDKLTVQLIEEYAHMDFIMAYNAGTKVNAPVLEFLNNNCQ